MKTIIRALVGVSGALSCLMALALWLSMDALLPRMGIQMSDLADGLVGRATVRADIAGLFGGMGLAMLIASLRQSRAWTEAALLFVSIAFTGRLVGLALDGAPAAVIPPIVVEAIAVALLASYRARLR